MKTWNNFKTCVNVHHYNEYADNPPTHAVIEITVDMYIWIQTAGAALKRCKESYTMNRFAHIADFGHCETDGEPDVNLFTDGQYRIDVSILNVKNDGELFLEVYEKYSGDKWETEPFEISQIKFS